jgi:hypothetical protein
MQKKGKYLPGIPKCDRLCGDGGGGGRGGGQLQFGGCAATFTLSTTRRAFINSRPCGQGKRASR